MELSGLGRVGEQTGVSISALRVFPVESFSGLIASPSPTKMSCQGWGEDLGPCPVVALSAVCDSKGIANDGS